MINSRKTKKVTTDYLTIGIKTLALLVISTTGFWMVEGRYFVPREEMQKEIISKIAASKNENPYIKDQQLILEGVRKIDKLNENITEIKTDVATIKADVKNFKKDKTEKEEK